MNIENYFPVAVAHHTVDQDLANKVESVMIREIEKLERNDENTLHTDFYENKISVHELFPQLIDKWIHAVAEYQSITSISIDQSKPLEYWTQDYKEGDTHSAHNHGASGISGIYWVRANNAAGNLRIHTPNPLSGYVKVDNEENPYTATYVDIKPEKGKMIIFPSYLKHEVLQSNADAIRTTIAFNLLG